MIVGGASSLINPKTGDYMFNQMPDDFKQKVKGAFDLYHERKFGQSFKYTFVSPALNLVDELKTNSFNIGGDFVLYDAKGESKTSIYDLAHVLVLLTENDTHYRRITVANR